MTRDRVLTGRKGNGYGVVIGAVLAASDPIDRFAWRRLIAPQAHVRIANRQPAIGQANVLAELNWLWSRTAALGRGFIEIWPSRNAEAVLLELDLTPIPEGPPLPIALIMRGFGADGTVCDLRFYFDPRPLAGCARLPRR